jgi:hypothetical protein
VASQEGICSMELVAEKVSIQMQFHSRNSTALLPYIARKKTSLIISDRELDFQKDYTSEI